MSAIESEHRDTPWDAARLSSGIRRGDRAAFSFLYQTRFDSLFRFARVYTSRDEQFCLDVVQETFLRVIKSIPPLASEQALDAWLTRALRSAAIDLLRKEKATTRLDRARARPEAAHQGPTSSEQAEWMSGRLAQTDADTEALLRSRVGEGRSLDHVSRNGMTRGAVHGRVRRALEALRRAAREAFGDD